MRLSVTHTSGKTGSAAVMALTALAFTLMFIIFPYSGDDYWYMSHFQDYVLDGEGEFPWDGLLRCWSEHFNYDNIRLGNLIYTFFLMLPRWEGALCSGALLWGALQLAWRISGMGRPTVWKALAVCVPFTFLPCWNDCIFVLCFQFNYVWATFVSLWCMYLWMRGNAHLMLSVAVAFAAGWWHEGFSLSLLSGMVAVMMFYPRYGLTRHRVTMVAALCAGIAVLFACPGQYVRGGWEHGGVDVMLFIRFLRYHPAFVIYMLLSCVALAGRRTRALVTGDPIWLLLLVTTAACYVMHAYFHYSQRIGWFAQVTGIIGALWLAMALWRVSGVSRWLIVTVKGVLAVAGVLMAWHLVETVRVSWIIRHEVTAAEEAYRRSDDGVVFTPLTTELNAPFITMKRPCFTLLYDPYSRKCITRAFSGGELPPLRVVPVELEHVTCETGRPVSGIDGLREYKGWFFMPAADGDYPAETTGAVVAGGHRVRANELLMTVFTSRADGARYVWVYPTGCFIAARIIGIDGIIPD